MDDAYIDSVVWMTERVRFGDSDLYRSLRHALAERSIDVMTSAIADFVPMGTSLEEGAESEPHQLVIVNAGRCAFVGHLVRTATSASFDRWREVPAARISDHDVIVRTFIDNGRRKRPWSDGIDPRYTDPLDFLYNDLIQFAVRFLDHSEKQTEPGAE